MKTLLFFFVTSFWAVAGDIEGLIHFQTAPHTPTAVTRYGSTAEHASMSHGPTADVNAVVYIAEDFSDSSFAPPTEHPVMDQRNEQFEPYILPVLVGTTVDFPNNDKVYHNVFSFSKTKTFDLGKYPTKTFKQVTFDKTGIVSLYCEIHAHMNAFILVLPNPYFASVAPDGKFRIADVPAGTFTLKAFSGRGQEIEQKVTVPESGSVRVEFFQ